MISPLRAFSSFFEKVFWAILACSYSAKSSFIARISVPRRSPRPCLPEPSGRSRARGTLPRGREDVAALARYPVPLRREDEVHTALGHPPPYPINTGPPEGVALLRLFVGGEAGLED